MKIIITIKEQLQELGLKNGDKINILDKNYSDDNPFTIDFDKNVIVDNEGYDYEFIELWRLEFEKHVPTKEEILEELESKSKKFEKGKDNYEIYYHHCDDEVCSANCYENETLNALYFDEETAYKICDELNSNKEKMKILFDLDE